MMKGNLAYSSYQQNSVAVESPARLVEMLYEGILRFASMAKRCIDANDIEKLLNILKVICLYNNDKHVVLSLFNKVTMDTYKFYLDGFEFMFYSYFNMRKSKN